MQRLMLLNTPQDTEIQKIKRYKSHVIATDSEGGSSIVPDGFVWVR
jgi:hypothetical protein